MGRTICTGFKVRKYKCCVAPDQVLGMLHYGHNVVVIRTWGLESTGTSTELGQHHLDIKTHQFQRVSWWISQLTASSRRRCHCPGFLFVSTAHHGISQGNIYPWGSSPLPSWSGRNLYCSFSPWPGSWGAAVVEYPCWACGEGWWRLGRIFLAEYGWLGQVEIHRQRAFYTFRCPRDM